MALTPRLIFATAIAVVAALLGTPRALACGSNGYSYAGLGAPQPASGISATLTSVADFDVRHGHVAAYVGVGGPGEGPGGSSEWLQIGLSRFPGVTGSDIYYEDALPKGHPVYHQVASGVPAGNDVDVAVREIHTRPNWWRAWLNGTPVSRPIHLPDSDRRWRPVATAEGWDGGTGGACNTFLYNFRSIRVARARGASWHTLSGARMIRSSVTHLRRVGNGAAFLALEGRTALRLLP